LTFDTLTHIDVIANRKGVVSEIKIAAAGEIVVTVSPDTYTTVL